MNKNKFLELVKNPDLIEEKDLTKLDELISEHPYSQILHILNVKGSKVFDKPDFEKSLNLAATYAYDRGLLRTIVDSNEIQTAPPPDQTGESVEDIPEEELEETSDFSWINDDENEDDIFIDNVSETISQPVADHNPLADSNEDVIQEYEEETSDKTTELDEGIEEAKTESPEEVDSQTTTETTPQNQEPDHPESKTESLADSENSSKDDPVASVETETGSEPNAVTETETGASTEPGTDTSSDKQETIDSESVDQSVGEKIEPAKSVEEPDPQKKSSRRSKKKGKAAKAPKTANDEPSNQEEPDNTLDKELEAEVASDGIHAELMKNLHQLQESKQNYEEAPDNNGTQEHQLEQIEIIDNFIKNSPVLSKPNLSAESEVISQDDLSKRSTKIDNEMASENLAKIYVKQGKRKDAEKIYKKLMVKFPQKKGYFADQIQKLKKK